MIGAGIYNGIVMILEIGIAIIERTITKVITL